LSVQNHIIEVASSIYIFKKGAAPRLDKFICFKTRRKRQGNIAIMTLVKVAQVGDIKENAGREVKIGDTRIALFYTNGRYYAIEALCRHQDGSLAPGKVEGEVVECPLHFWHYNIKTGQLLDYLDGVRLNTYEVRVVEDQIYLEIAND
jgi:nitrite reductase/ring-hydroxylating ferredoxin subunit